MDRQEMIDRLLYSARNAFDNEESMVAKNYDHWVGGYHTRRVGLTHEVRGTADYAAAALILRQEQDYDRALRALDKICELQDVREGSATYGLWSYYLEEDLDHMRAPDYNWSDFIGKDLIGVCILCDDLLPEELKHKLYRSIRNAMECSLKRNVAADYTNMSIMGSMTIVAAGELLQDERLSTEGMRRLEQLYEYTVYNGAFSEYNSSAYILVAMHEIARMFVFFKNTRARYIAKELNHYAWEMLASHYNASIGQLTPPQARSYRDVENGSLAWTIWLGTNGRYGKEPSVEALEAGAVSLDSLCFLSKCPHDIEEKFAETERFLAHTYYRMNQIRNASEDVTIIRELDSPDLTAYSYQTEQFSMGAFAFCDCWTQRRNVMVIWDGGHPKVFRLRCINGDYDFCSGVVNTMQDHNRILGHLGLVTDRGSFHYILDQDKNGIYDTDRLEFRFELGGDCSGLTIEQKGQDFLILDGSMRICLHIEKWVFDGKEKSAKLSEDGKAVILEGYRGEMSRLDTNRLEDTYGVFALEVDYGDETDSQSEGISLSVLFNGRIASFWDSLQVESYRCPVPYRKALGLDGLDFEQIGNHVQTILDKMKEMEADGTVEESCPISIISMDAWEWPQGVALFAMYQYYQETEKKEILQYLMDWFDRQLEKGLPEQNINTTCPMLTLSCIYEETKEKKYLPVLQEWLEGVMERLPRTKEGGLQHVVSGILNPGQLWDDTLYMTVLFLAKMGWILKEERYIQESIHQFLVHIKYLTDPPSGLFFHGWTFEGRHHFAKALWGRGNSWYTAGLVDYLECLQENEGVKKFLLDTLLTQAEALEACQDEGGLWHTLLDDPTSYLETSASCAFAYGILKAVRKGYLPARFLLAGERAVKGVLEQIANDGTVMGVSYGTPVCNTLEEYRQIPVCPMPYGQSMALMMLIEARKIR